MLLAHKLSLWCVLLAAVAPLNADARLVLWKYRVPSQSLSLARDFSPASNGICDDPVNTALPFCDASRSTDERIDDLVARIPLSAVGGLMIDNATELVATNPPVHLPAYPWWNEALHGVGDCVGVKFRAPTLYATSYPQVVGVAASFNRTLFYRLGEAIGTEARAFYNAGNSGLTYWAPNVNIFRDPRWGRGQETPGEDPVLTSEYAVAFVRGMQGDPMEGEAPATSSANTTAFLKVSATCKHFSSYSQEFARHRNDAIVTKQDQADTYFPMFEACIKRGRATGVMCSYNAVNGIPACADRNLLTGLVREQWGFDGYIMSDCGAVLDVVSEHHYTQSPLQTCASTLNAGMDLNCGQFLQQHLVAALDKGIVKPEVVRTALKRLYRMQMRLGMFEKHPQPFADVSPSQVDSVEHRRLALEAAHQSVVLLKNEGNVLPLNAASASAVALVGPHFNGSTVFLGNYAGIPSSISTPLGAISTYAKNVSYALGCNVSTSEHDFEEAETVAKHADQVVLFVGLDQSQEREDLDRETLQLPGFQPELIDRVLKVATKPVVLVVIAGGCVDLSKYKDNAKVGAIVYVGYPGQSGGQAIADVLYGAVNPSGRLTQTFYSESFVETTSLYDMHMRPHEPTGNPGRTYRFYNDSPVFAFGDGLSYTSFHVAPTAAASCDANGVWSAQVTVGVTNTGKRAGEFVALVFAVPPYDDEAEPHRARPLKSLVAFDRTRLLSGGEAQILTFQLTSAAFALADEHGQVATHPGAWELVVENERIRIPVGEGEGCGVRLDKAKNADLA